MLNPDAGIRARQGRENCDVKRRSRHGAAWAERRPDVPITDTSGAPGPAPAS